MISQRKSPSRADGARVSAVRESALVMGFEKFMSAILTISWFQCYKTIYPDEILDRFARGDLSKRLETAKWRRQPRIDLPCDCRAACRQTYWTSASGKSVSSPGRRLWKWPVAGASEKSKPRRGAKRPSRRSGREPMVISLDKSARNRASGPAEGTPAPEAAPISAAGLKFEIQPATNLTSEKDRAAKLVDPGFGRIFTDHMAVVRYSQAKGWHDARVES